jgi:hypothetical protein
MIATDAPFMAKLRENAGTHMCAWFAHRDALTIKTGRLQALLFHTSIYTDDSSTIKPGCARMVHLIVTWKS